MASPGVWPMLLIALLTFDLASAIILRVSWFPYFNETNNGRAASGSRSREAIAARPTKREGNSRPWEVAEARPTNRKGNSRPWDVTDVRAVKSEGDSRPWEVTEAWPAKSEGDTGPWEVTETRLAKSDGDSRPWEVTDARPAEMEGHNWPCPDSQECNDRWNLVIDRILRHSDNLGQLSHRHTLPLE